MGDCDPSFPYRFTHMAVAAFLVSALLVVGTAGWHLLKGRRDQLIKKSFSYGLWMVLATSVAQVFVGDMHGLNTLKHQPTKLAAIEGHWETNHDHGMPLLLFAIPDMEQEKNHFEIAIPNLGSIILTHTLDGKVTGLKEYAPEDRPNVPIVFWSFRVMVGMGMLMVLMSLTALYLRKRNSLYETTWFHKFAFVMTPSGYIALLAGWVTTEVGRQPWTVYGVMRTEQALRKRCFMKFYCVWA